MAHDYHVALQGTAGRLTRLVLPTETTGLTLGSLDQVIAVSNGDLVADVVATLGLSMAAVDGVDAPGIYELLLVPDAEGTLFLRIVHLGVMYEFVIQVASALNAADPGLEGDFTATILAGSAPVPGATVRVYAPSSGTLVQRGTTNSAGQVTFFGLPVGSYQLRAYASGVDLQDVNPTTITVVAGESENPIISYVTPGSASIGDVIGIQGRFFAAESEVIFGTGTPVVPNAVSDDGTLILVEVPTGLTDTVIPLRVTKPDLADPPSGILTSASAVFVRV